MSSEEGSCDIKHELCATEDLSHRHIITRKVDGFGMPCPLAGSLGPARRAEH